MTLIEKVVSVILRDINQRTEILVFKHPIAGIQIVKGTVETNEELEKAALRELYEESGISSAHIHSYLGLHHHLSKVLTDMYLSAIPQKL